MIALDELAKNSWAMILFLGAGFLLTLFLCKLAKIPYVNARIGCATVIFVSCTIESTGVSGMACSGLCRRYLQ